MCTTSMHDVDAFCQGPSAGSRNLLCKWLKGLAVKTHANSTTSGLRSMVEPQTRGWQKAWEHAPSSLAHPSLLLGRLIVLT